MVETRAQAKLKNKTVEMTSEAPESTSPITITETEHAVRISASVPITTDRAVESMEEQAVVEGLMAKQAYRIVTSFMAAMEKLSSELWTLFQERMPVTSSATPPRQISQERERFEPYGESSSLGASGRTQASGYGQHSQPTWAKQPHAFRGPTTRPSSHCGSPDPSWPKQRDRCLVTTVQSEQSDRFTITGVAISARLSPSVRFGHSNNNTYAPRSNLRRLSNAARLGRNGQAPCSSGPTDRAIERCATGPAATSNPAGVVPSGSSDRRCPAHDQGQLSPGAARGTKLY
ncbi:unnamed protein product [Prunus armeniaca]